MAWENFSLYVISSQAQIYLEDLRCIHCFLKVLSRKGFVAFGF